MKKPLLLLTVMLMTVTMMAQNSGKISIQVSGKPLYEVLSEIQNLSGYTIFYSRDAVAMQKKVDFSASKEPAKEAITRLLTQNGVNFTINGKDVVVLADSPKKEKATVSGTLIDDMGYPLPGGGVMVAGTEQFTAWQQGYMDIHHISTGRGNCTFMILPDGTTMMVDAGDNGPDNPKEVKLARVPDESLTPGEWIVRYASHFLGKAGLPARLDYMLLTHFHNDHMGTPVAGYPMSMDGSYYQIGVSCVGNNLAIGKLVDRGYPDYDFPYTGAFVGNLMMSNYMKFIKDGNNRVEEVAGFETGAADQFVLKNAPRNDFSIRNIYSNGQIWTGSGISTKNLIPADTPQADLDNENIWSAVINISYGDFDYHTGGDILGADLDGTWFANDWRDIETPVAKLIKETDVMCCNHHGYNDAMNNTFLYYTTPQACVVPAWETEHPGADALSRMATAGSNVFAAGPVTSDSLKSGHVVVRVYEGGSTFQIFVLDDESTDYKIAYQSGMYTSAN